MSDHGERLQQGKKPEPSKSDKAALEAEPNWDRMGQIAKRLMATKPDRQSQAKAAVPKRARVEGAEMEGDL